VAKRSYGTGRLFVVVDRGGRASWYGSSWAGSTRVKRKIGATRTAGNADGLTRTQAERELRRLVDATTVVAKGQRRTIGEAGEVYIAHLETVMERKRTTIADYRGYLRRHLAPFFGDRPMDRLEPAQIERYLHAKHGDGLSPKTVQNHLNFLHGIPQARPAATPAPARRDRTPVTASARSAGRPAARRPQRRRHARRTLRRAPTVLEQRPD
jgi:Phage integrase, N-terminal SAM-like domain